METFGWPSTQGNGSFWANWEAAGPERVGGGGVKPLLWSRISQLSGHGCTDLICKIDPTPDPQPGSRARVLRLRGCFCDKAFWGGDDGCGHRQGWVTPRRLQNPVFSTGSCLAPSSGHGSQPSPSMVHNSTGGGGPRPSDPSR